MNDPDELIFELGALKMLAGGTLNPGWFGHPATTTLYLLAIIDVATFATGHVLGLFPSLAAFGNAVYDDPSLIILPARIAMVLFGVACVFLTYRLGERLFSRQVGIAAAAILAVSPVHIAWSQVVRSDIMATVFLLLMLLTSLRYARNGGWRPLLLAALWFGCATTTKWPFAACSVSFAAAAIYRACSGQDSAGRAVCHLAVFTVAGIGAILLISPYLALDYHTALKSVMGEAQVRHVGSTGHGVWWNAGWYLRVPLLHAFGWAGLALTATGAAIGARRREAALLIFPLLLVLVAVTITQNLIWERWTLPLLPLLAIFAGVGIAAMLKRVHTLPISPIAMRGLTVLIVAVVLVPLLANASSDATERLHDTRQAATRWADRNLPPDSRIIVEHFGFDLLQRPWQYYFPLVDAGCVDARALLKGKIQYSMIESNRGGHHNVDYGTLAATMRSTCHANYAILSQYDRYMAEAPMFPEEVASYRELMSRSTLLATITPQEGAMGGPTIRIVRIDRPYSLAQAPNRANRL